MAWTSGNAIGFFAGVATASAVIAVAQSVGHRFYPVAEPKDLKDRKALKRKIARLPLGAFVFVEMAYLLGSLSGGIVVALIASPSGSLYTTIALAVVLTACGIMNMVDIPHPKWFAILSTCTYFPAALAGWGLVTVLK